MKYKVLTNDLQDYKKGDVIDGNTQIGSNGYIHQFAKKFPGIFEPVEEYQVGDWVVDKNDWFIFRIHKFNPLSEKTNVIGTGYNKDDDEWYDKATAICWYSYIKRKATKDEIEQALIKEAKRRGFENGKTIIPVDSENKVKLENGYIGGYNKVNDSVYFDAQVIYRQGQWAEIIEDEPIVINGHEAEFKDGYVQFGCAKIDNLFFTEIAKSDNDGWHETGRGNRKIASIKIGKGEFTLKQIKQIAARIGS